MSKVLPCLSLALKEERAKRNLTQEEMAENIGMNLRTYQRYEAGKYPLCFDNLIFISEYLEISIDNLLQGK